MSFARQFLEEAEATGLLTGNKTTHIRIRTTKALLDAAKRQTGIASTAELVRLGLANLALNPVYRSVIDKPSVQDED